MPRSRRGAPFLGIDLLNGTTGQTQWSPTGPLDGQVFVAVEPHDWLVGTTPPPVEPPVDETLPILLARIEVRLGAIEQAVRAIPPCTIPSVAFPIYDLTLGFRYLGTGTGTATPRR